MFITSLHLPASDQKVQAVVCGLCKYVRHIECCPEAFYIFGVVWFQPIKFLTEVVISKGMTVLQAKMSILRELKLKQIMDVPPVDRYHSVYSFIHSEYLFSTPFKTLLRGASGPAPAKKNKLSAVIEHVRGRSHSSYAMFV